MKAQKMSTLSERIHISEAPGYWAVEIHLGEAAPARRYLCHAENDRAAVSMAGRLMGASVEARGFDSLWISEALLEKGDALLPGLIWQAEPCVSSWPWVQARVLRPPMFIAQDPHTPSRHERRKARVGSTSFLMWIRTSRTIGPQASTSTS